MSRIEPGQVLWLTPDNTMYLREACWFRVRQTRPDLARYYAGELLWLTGDVLDPDGQVREATPVLIRVAAFG